MQKNSTEVEVMSYAATNIKTGKAGILVLPWYNNTRTTSDPSIGVPKGGRAITDHNGEVYIPFAMLHTHPDWPWSSRNDVDNAKYWESFYPGFKSYILYKEEVWLYYPIPPPLGGLTPLDHFKILPDNK